MANFGDEDPTVGFEALLKKLAKDSPGDLEENKYYNQLRVLIQTRNLD